MYNKIKSLLLTVVFFVILSNISQAQILVKNSMFSNGAMSISANNYFCNSTIGQVLIGNQENTLLKNQIGFWSVIGSVTDVEDEFEGIPNVYELYQNYPNPFNPSTTIKYGLPIESNVRIVLFNILGESVRGLFDNTQEAGYHQLHLTLNYLASGIYFYTIEAKALDNTKNFVSVKKMILLK